MLMRKLHWAIRLLFALLGALLFMLSVNVYVSEKMRS